ncbi:MAG TPA: hypothetical protein VF316_04115 [Polyangiaceae bacterium]
MGDVLHRVVVDLILNGQGGSVGSFGPSISQAESRLGALESRASGVASTLAGVGSGMADAFTSSVESVGRIVTGLGMAAGMAGIGAVVHGVMGLNNEAEKLQISLGTIFSANGLAGDMQDGMQKSADIMKTIRHDAAALPGETQDLVGIFKAIAIPGARAGGSINSLEHLSANIMAAGAVAGLQMDMVARESAQLVAGRAGAHNVLGSTLLGLTGSAAESFNKSSPEARLAILEAGMNKYAGSVAYFNTTFDAQWSSLIDNVKFFGKEATKPLFEGVKHTLAHVNDWLSNSSTVDEWAARIGDRLADAWSWGTKTIAEWWPAIQSFAASAYDALSGLWTEFGPAVTGAANALKGALSDGSALEKIESILKLYGAVKMGGVISGAAGTLGSAASSMAGGGAGLAGMLANPVGLAVAGAVIVDGLALAGAMHAAADSTSEYHERATEGFADLSTQWSALTDTMSVSVMPALELFGVTMLRVVDTELSFINGLIGTIKSVKDVDGAPAAGFNGKNYETASWENGFNLQNWIGGNFGNNLNSDESARNKDWEDSLRNSRSTAGMSAMSTAAIVSATVAEVKKTKAPSGGGGTSIQKVEIVVSSNADPSRVARLVFNEVANLSRNPKASPDAPNYSSTR